MSKILTITGPSCSGKTTLLKKLVETSMFAKIITTTSRSPRKGEEHGVDYYFKSQEECEITAKEGAFVEHTKINGKFYGVEFDEISRAKTTGLIPIIVLDPEGVKSFTKQFQIVSLYIDSSIEELYYRFLLRVRENPLSDITYEVTRLLAINKEYETWWMGIKYSIEVPGFSEHTEKEVIETILKAKDKGRFND